MDCFHVFQERLSNLNISWSTEDTVRLSMERTGVSDIAISVHQLKVREHPTWNDGDEDILLMKWRLRFSLCQRRTTQEAFAQESIRCQIRCSIHVPRLLLEKFEGLVQRETFGRFMLAVWLTSASLCSVQFLWQASNWKLYLLPQSDVLQWSFLCIKRETERRLTMKFHEGGFLLLRVSDIRNPTNEHVNYQSISDVTNSPELILSLLDKTA